MSKSAGAALAAGKISVAVFLSRILGLVRDQVFARLFGASFYMDAWLVAFRVPGMLRDLFAEGALSSAFVPTFTETLEKGGRRAAFQLANLVLSSLMVVLGAFSIVLFFFPDVFVTLLAAGFHEVPGKVEVTSNLVRILAPFLLLIALASTAMGMLNALNHFFLPALAPALFNILVILAGLFLAPRFEEADLFPIYAMGAGALAGGMMQLAVQIPLLRREGFRFRFRIDWRDPGIRRIARLIGPAIVGVGAVQINVLVNTQLASFLQENGPVSWLGYAFRIIYLPIGLFGVAVGVVNLKEVSVHVSRQSWEEVRETVANSLKLISFLAIPSTAGLIVLAVPTVRALFERGDFTPDDTLFTAHALMLYALGLYAYSCIKVYVPTFYALGDTRTPVRISLLSVLVNLLANVTLILILPGGFKYLGLALGTALSVTVNSALMAYQFQKRLGALEKYQVARMQWKAAGASLVMGGVVWATLIGLESTLPGGSLHAQLIRLFLCIGVGVAVYTGLCLLLRVREVRLLLFWNRS